MKESLEPMGFQHIEIMGHQRVAGFVTPRPFGGAVLLHVAMPAQEPVVVVLTEGRWINQTYCGAGSRIRVTRQAVDQHVGMASVFRMTSCSEESCVSWQPAQHEILELVGAPALHSGAHDHADEDEEFEIVDELEASPRTEGL